MSIPMAGAGETRPARRFASGRAVRGLLLVVALTAAAIVIPPARHAALRALGSALLLSDPIESGDVAVISETGGYEEFQAAELEVSDLYSRRQIAQVMLMRATPDAVDEELTRRGVRLEDPTIATLRQLGIPESHVVMINTGEGGTTDSTRALAQWARAHPSRVLVVIGAAHSRRYRRALLRVWPASSPPPRIIYPRRTAFRADSWWTSRRTLRDGLFELQKLALDYVRHPW